MSMRRRLSITLVMLALTGIGAGACQRESERAERAERFEAREFVVHDSEGGVRARLDPQGLSVFDAGGKLRAKIFLTPNAGSSVWLHDEAGRPRISLLVEPSGEPSIALFDAEGNVTAELPTEAD